MVLSFWVQWLNDVTNKRDIMSVIQRIGIKSSMNSYSVLKTAFAVLLILVSLQLMAYSPPPRLPGIVQGGWAFFLTIVPPSYDRDNGELKEKEPAKSAIYELLRTGELKKVWELEGWYEYPDNIFLTSDGKTVVRIRTHYINQDGSYYYKDFPDQDLIAIYRKEGKVAGYSAAELITDTKKGVQWQGWFYSWVHDRGDKKPMLKWQRVTEVDESGIAASVPTSQYFEIHTLEGFRYSFDLGTGLILKKEPYK